MNKRGKVIYLGKGRHRKTFMFEGGKFVYKLPIGQCGIDANRREIAYYKAERKKGRIPFAACRLLRSGVLVMEYVKPHCNSLAASNAANETHSGTANDIEFPGDSDDDLPDWIVSVECTQVGYDRTGLLVAYDYADC